MIKYKVRQVHMGKRVEETVFNHYHYKGVQRKVTPVRNSNTRKRKDNIKRSQNRIRSLTFTNSVRLAPLLIRLSYAENMQCRKTAQKDFARFIRTLRSRYPYIKYLYVFEYQKRGAIHIHMLLFESGFLPFNEIEMLWPHGGTRVERVRSRERAGNYVGKYCGKALSVQKFLRGYSVSHNLEKPEIHYGLETLKVSTAYTLAKTITICKLGLFITKNIYSYGQANSDTS